MNSATALADAACLARLRGLTSRTGLPSSSDLEGFARAALALASRSSVGRRRSLHGDARLYLRARREQRRVERASAARELHGARLAREAAETLVKLLPGSGAEALLLVALRHFNAVTSRAAAVVAGR